MANPTEYKTVQARILAYAREIRTYVPRDEGERRRGFDLTGPRPEERARKSSLFFGDLLHSQVRKFNPKYNAEGTLVGDLFKIVPQRIEELKKRKGALARNSISRVERKWRK